MPEATHSTSLILLLCATIFGGILLTFIPRFPAVIPTYCGLWLLRLSGFAAISGPTMLWWGVASAIVTGLIYLLPREISGSRRGLPYIATGTLAGPALSSALCSAHWHTAAPPTDANSPSQATVLSTMRLQKRCPPSSISR